MKYRLKSQAKPTHFHGIFNFNTVTKHPDALPVIFGKRRIIVSIKCWTLRSKQISKINRKTQRLQTKVPKYSQIQTPKRTDRSEFMLIWCFWD